MIVNWFQVKAYLKYKKTAKYRKGHRIHPPFAFDLVRRLFYEKHKYYHFDVIDDFRRKLKGDKTVIEVSDFGAGSRTFKSKKRKVSELVKYNATPKKQGELISRLVSEFKPKNILELGTSLGIGTLYLALPNSQAKVTTIEGCKEINAVAKKIFTETGVNNVKAMCGAFSDVLPKVFEENETLDMVYFDGHHNYAATINNFELCLAKAKKDSVFIFDDIYWSAEMEKAWNYIIQSKEVSISFDLFRVGIVILKKQVQKQHYIVAWP